LSALLAEVTSDPLYLQAEMDSANFIHSHLLNNGQNIVFDTIFARTNDSCAVVPSIWPLNSGLMIEGLSIPTSITQN
ncbi:hypothetical protein DFH09DRAFT_879141, partial [Mycena vulgaris]